MGFGERSRACCRCYDSGKIASKVCGLRWEWRILGIGCRCIWKTEMALWLWMIYWRIFQDLMVSSSVDVSSLGVQRLVFKNKSAERVGKIRTPRVRTSSNNGTLRRLMRHSCSTANDTYRSILICESVLGKCPSIRWWAPLMVIPYATQMCVMVFENIAQD